MSTNAERNSRIIERYRAGLKFDAIAAELGITRNVVAGVMNRAGIADRGSGGPVADMIGLRFGRMTVVDRAPNSLVHRGAYWNCICDCGNISRVYGKSLRNGATRSCGCLRGELAATRLRAAWRALQMEAA